MTLRPNSYLRGNADSCASLVLLAVILPCAGFLLETQLSQSLTTGGLTRAVPPVERGGMHVLRVVGADRRTRRQAGTWKEAGLL